MSEFPRRSLRPMCLPKILLLPLLSVGLSAALAQESEPLYRLDFAEGSLTNKGTIGGLAEENPARTGPVSVQVTQDADGVWQALFEPFPNGSQGPSLLLPESGDKLRLGEEAGGLTISTWLKWNGPDQHPDAKQPIIWKAYDQSTPGWALSVTEGGVLRFDWRTNSGSMNHRLSEQVIAPGEWHQVAVTWKNDDKSGLEFYIDGNPVKATVSFTGGGPLETAEESIVVGAQPYGHMPLNGSLRDLRVYDRALEADEVSVLAETPSR